MRQKALPSIVFAVAIFLAIPVFVRAATFSIVPSSASGSYAVGQVFSVPVTVSTGPSDPINAVSAVLSFPANLLQVVSVDKGGSVVDFWVSNPSFSNSEGTVSFEGGIYNPGFSGSGGKVVSILFKAKAPGSANLSFISSSILANDGQGSNILERANASSITIVPAGQAKTDTAASVGTQSIVITSTTHPDSEKWYPSGTVDLSWTLPVGANAVRMSYDRNPTSLPTVLYSPPVSTKELVLKDGIWYFHIQARDNDGWGSVTHFKIQIDSVPPIAPHISFPHGLMADDPRPAILFNTADELSGIDYYTVQVSGGTAVRVDKQSVASSPYVLSSQDPGSHSVSVVAFDKAGNQSSDEATFQVVGIEAPVFDEFERELVQGDKFQLSGSTYPNSNVTVVLRSADGQKVSQTALAGGYAGRFLMVWNTYLTAGKYLMSAQVVDEHGAKSAWTQEVIINVRAPALARIGVPILNMLTLGIIFVGTIACLVALTSYLIYRLRKYHRKLRSRIKKADMGIHERFKKLSNTLAQHVRALEKAKGKRDLTAEEAKIFESLTKSLDQAEQDIEKEVDQIDR